MLHVESKSRCLESQDGSSVDPCSKKMKSTEEPYGKSYDGLQSLYEEIHIKKTHSGFIPLSLSDDEDGVDETTRDLVPFKEGFLSVKPVTCKSLNAANNTETTRNKYAFSSNSTAVVNHRENNESLEESKNEGDADLYSTSKVFIGPIYKIEVVQQSKEKKNYNRNHQKVPKAMHGRSSVKEMASKQSLTCDIPKIEDELSQFYSEIHQLESDENILDKAERDFHNQPMDHNKWNQIESVISRDLSYNKTASNCDGGQWFYSEPSDRRTCSEQNPYNGQVGHRTGNGQSFNNERNAWEPENPCNKEASSRFWNDSVPPFKPGWQQMPPFIIPYGPPPSQFIPNFNFQEPVSSLHHSNNFSSSNAGPFENTHISMSCSPSDKNRDRTSHSGTPSIQTIQNGYSVCEGYVGNGFCENATSWKDTQPTEGSSSVSQQFPEGSLCESQKLLLILRGLPGSGKTTLSRILLGQTRDGIVFSTDDYFCQQDGWSYNISQLGAAHDWNQKRAKQAMDQGRSPIIIDNTNTQAWEMKPYVEAALEKCYRVEFHEPDTWWKFDPGELEKETVVKKTHKLHKMKQKRKRKRNRKMKGATVKVMEVKPDHQTPSDKDWSQSGEVDSEDNEKSASLDGSLKELRADGEVNSPNESSPKHSELDIVEPIASDKFLQIDILSRDECSPSTSVPFVPNENITELQSGDNFPDAIQNENLVETKNSILEFKNQSSPSKSNAGNSPVLSSIEEKTMPIKISSELGPGSKSLGNEKKVPVFNQHKVSSETERNTWAFFSFDMVGEQPDAGSYKNESCLTWPEGSSNVIYEQRARKARKFKQVFSEKTIKFSDNKSNKLLEKGGDGAALNGGNKIIGCSLRSPLTVMPSTEASNFPTESVTKDNVPSGVPLLTAPTGKGRCRRIFNLAPKFDLSRQIPIRKDEKVLRDTDVLIEQEKFSDASIRDEVKQSLECYGTPVTSSYAVLVDSLCPDVESLVCNLVPAKLTEARISSKKVVASPIQLCTSASLPRDGQTVTPDNIVEVNTDRKKKTVQPDISTTQPDILYSVKATTEYLTNSVAEQYKNMHQIYKLGATKCPRTEYEQGLLRIKSSFLTLPISLGFAHQLVKLFGSPAVPLDTLIPDDYVVPLDWTISKEIYLRWKASVEKKQKKNRFKGKVALPAGAAALEDSKEVDGQEKQESSDANPQMHLFQ